MAPTPTSPPEHPAAVDPLLRWAGGKRRLVPLLAGASPHDYNTYYEPFFGGGAFYFRHVAPTGRKAVLGDINPHLINFYLQVRENTAGLTAAIRQLIADYGDGTTETSYLQVRSIDPATLEVTERAAWFYWLNQTCFNGLWRENAAGRFNVPWGKRKTGVRVDETHFQAAAAALAGAEIREGGFMSTLTDIRAGDFAYLDPPYIPLSQTAAFTAYTKHSFAEIEQAALAGVIRGAVEERGAQIMLSNSETPLTRRIYRDCGLRLHTISASRSVAASGSSRSPVKEVLGVSYPVSDMADPNVVERFAVVAEAIRGIEGR